MSAQFVDFRIIKQRISIEQVLAHYAIRLRRTNDTSLRGFCPLPTHSSEKSRESFGVAIDKNIWACQSASCAEKRQGKKGGNVLDLVAVMESCSVRDAAVKLNDWFLSGTERLAPAVEKEEKKLVAEKSESVNSSAGNTPLSFSLRGIDPTHAYFETRGISEESARYFNVGFFPGRGSMSGRIVIPIANENGQLVAYAGRSIDDSEPKYKFPSGFKKSEALWNLDRLQTFPQQSEDPLIVVEGFFDCMKIHQAGFVGVVALMGSAMSDAQEKLLDPFREIVVMLDGDQAGQTAAPGIVTRLARAHYVRIITIFGQPDQMSSEDIQAVLADL